MSRVVGELVGLNLGPHWVRLAQESNLDGAFSHTLFLEQPLVPRSRRSALRCLGVYRHGALSGPVRNVRGEWGYLPLGNAACNCIYVPHHEAAQSPGVSLGWWPARCTWLNEMPVAGPDCNNPNLLAT